jgi:hypothetical protein
MSTTIIWRKIDTPGHDACSLYQNAFGWAICGTAVYLFNNTPALANYLVTCDTSWQFLHGKINGFVESKAFEFTISRKNGLWTLNAVPVSGIETCIDLDLGFTPATNLIQLKRLCLPLNKKAEVPVAWIDISEGALKLLPQSYERKNEISYWYTAPSAGYSGLLEIDSTGFICNYPGLWVKEC